MPLSQAGLPQPKQTEVEILAHLTAWRENWMEWVDPRTESRLTRDEIWKELDRWLDRFGDHLKAKRR